MIKSVDSFLNLIDNINEWIGRIFSFLIIVLMLLIFVDVCGRYFFSSPLLWGLEVDGYLLVAIVFMGGGYAFLHNAHVRVDIIYTRWPPQARAIIDIITSLLIFLLCIVLIRYGFEIAWEGMLAGHKASTAVRTPMWPSYFVVPLSGVFLGLQCLVKWVRDWVMAVKGIKLESKVVPGEGGIFG